jgi:hypothetical protein|tara:strand:- start:847 stop:1470 length:624 start_codon:yes stop_codon:yes gene_type:complete
MALTKISRGLLNTGVSDSSDATAITIDSSENITTSGTFQVGASSGTNLLIDSSSDVMQVKVKKDGTDDIDLAFLTQASGGTLAEKMRIASDGQLSFNSGFGSVGKAYGVRAWARFDGSNSSGSFTEGTNAGNMSSFTRTAGGNYSLTMANAMPDTNYVVAGLVGVSGLIRGDNAGYASSTTVVKIETTNGDGSLFYNSTEICIAVIR